MRFRYFLLVILFIPSMVLAQYQSTNGNFEVIEKKGCAPFTVIITNPASSTFDPTWGDGSIGPPDDTTHVYNQPGTYVLRLQFIAAIGSDNITITVTPNTQPTFDVYTCGSREAQVKVTDTNYDSYIINYGDASAEVTVPKGVLATDNHTYTSSGNYTISVRGKNVSAADNCTPAATKSVDIVDALTAPLIDQLTVTSGSQIDLDLTTLNNVLYRLELATNTVTPASFQLVQTIHDVSTATITNSVIRTDDNYYCLRLGASDPCGNSLTQYSDIICSANFDATAQNNQNNLTWVTNMAGVSNFSLDRDGTILTPVSSPFIDPSICKTDSCYQLTINYTNTSRSISLQKCVTAFSTNTPTAIENVTAIVGDEAVELTWQQDPAFQPAEYSVFRKSGAGGYGLLSKTIAAQFNDPDYSTEQSFCYRVDYIDECDNLSATGIDTCPIQLTGNVAPDNSITLNWSNYSGWVNGVNEYIVEKYDGEGVLLQTFNVGSDLTFEDNAIDPDNQLYVYVIIANANDLGLGQTISNEITIIKQPNLFYPKAFTPNGDNLNDIFLVFGQFVVKFELNIFNRWGELLFTTSDLTQGWDGKYKGTAQPEGTYTFVANLTDLEGRTFKRSGSVVLLRKQ